MNQSDKKTDKKSDEVYKLEIEVILGLWIQFIGQLIELRALTALLELDDNPNQIGEKQILTGVWIRTIGQLLEAVSVTYQLNETDITKLIQEQKYAILGDFLTSIGAAYEVVGGLNAIEEEKNDGLTLIP